MSLFAWFALLKLLVQATQEVERIILEAAERKKAGNLLEIQAAVLKFKNTKSPEERDEAARSIQSAFK